MAFFSSILASVLLSAGPLTDSPAKATVEFRLLGQSEPTLFETGKLNRLESGERMPITGTDESIFDGTIIELTPTITEEGEIAYKGSITITIFEGFTESEPNVFSPIYTTETVALEGKTANHQAIGVPFLLLERTVYFALGDTARPKKDCPACGPIKPSNKQE